MHAITTESACHIGNTRKGICAPVERIISQKLENELGRQIWYTESIIYFFSIQMTSLISDQYLTIIQESRQRLRDRRPHLTNTTFLTHTLCRRHRLSRTPSIKLESFLGFLLDGRI